MAKLNATAEQIRSQIELRLKYAARDQGRCHDCVAPLPVAIERRGDGVNWTVAHFPVLPDGCTTFMMKVLEQVMTAYDLVDGDPAPPRRAKRQARGVAP